MKWFPRASRERKGLILMLEMHLYNVHNIQHEPLAYIKNTTIFLLVYDIVSLGCSYPMKIWNFDHMWHIWWLDGNSELILKCRSSIQAQISLRLFYMYMYVCSKRNNALYLVKFYIWEYTYITHKISIINLKPIRTTPRGQSMASWAFKGQ